jgi:hypothetical protein
MHQGTAPVLILGADVVMVDRRVDDHGGLNLTIRQICAISCQEAALFTRGGRRTNDEDA